ncbi:MAG: NfeD family protein [Elainellaceae cyanobacterium]
MQNNIQSPYQGKGKVDKAIAPFSVGRVYFQASFWPAQLAEPTCQTTLGSGEVVRVIGRDGLILLVMPDERWERTAPV